MQFRKLTLGLLMVGTLATAGVATASPAWATDPGTREASAGSCRITANAPSVNGARLRGSGARTGCANTVTYLWVRIYKVIPWWPDSEEGVKGQNYVQNGKLTATGSCDGHGEYYTHTSTATGASGDTVESDRSILC
jgi:hypothetical protein